MQMHAAFMFYLLHIHKTDPANTVIATDFIEINNSQYIFNIARVFIPFLWCCVQKLIGNILTAKLTGRKYRIVYWILHQTQIYCACSIQRDK